MPAAPAKAAAAASGGDPAIAHFLQEALGEPRPGRGGSRRLPLQAGSAHAPPPAELARRPLIPPHKPNVATKTEVGAPVVYVATGTLARPNAQQVAALASAVRAVGGARFVWSLPEPCHALLPADFRAWAAEAGRALVVAWAPQPAVLSHPATRLFVTHGGMNSIWEGLTAGIPLLVLPFFADQPINAQHIVNKRLGSQVRAACRRARMQTALLARVCGMSTPRLLLGASRPQRRWMAGASIQQSAQHRGLCCPAAAEAPPKYDRPNNPLHPPPTTRQLDPWKLKSPEVTRALTALLADGAAAERAAELGRRLRARSGAEAAADALEAFARGTAVVGAGR